MRTPFASLLLASISLFSARPAPAVTIAWLPVGNPGNPADTTVMNDGTSGYGSVAYNYRIGTYDVTSSQYAALLNAKDPTGANTLGLWNTGMADATYGGINFNAGNANGMKYSVISGNGNHPVNYVTWYDTIRFANWLNNGQGIGDTETGAYTLLGGTPIPSNGPSITRNAGATVFLASENEWYKAAFYNPSTSTYFQYPTASNATPTASAPTGLANHANFNNAVGNLTDVGAYTGTTSPYGAFDMGGNVGQWNETLIFGADRGLRGGSFVDPSFDLQSLARGHIRPVASVSDIGFRVAGTPEPATLTLLGSALLALGVLRLLRWRRTAALSALG